MSESDIADLKKLVIKKLDLNEDGFNNIWNGSNKSFRDYPSYYRFLTKYKKLIGRIIKLFMPMTPQFLIVDINDKKNN